jgi:hypothetical protein
MITTAAAFRAQHFQRALDPDPGLHRGRLFVGVAIG